MIGDGIKRVLVKMVGFSADFWFGYKVVREKRRLYTTPHDAAVISTNSYRSMDNARFSREVKKAVSEPHDPDRARCALRNGEVLAVSGEPDDYL